MTPLGSAMTGMRNSRLSCAEQNRLIKHFAAAATARTAAGSRRVNRVAATCFFRRRRQVAAPETVAEGGDLFGGEAELDEGCFGGCRTGERGRGAAGKAPALGVLKRGGKAHAQAIPDAGARTPESIIQPRARPDSIVGADRLRRCGAPDVFGASAGPHQPLEALRGRARAHQRDREFPEPGEAPPAAAQRHSAEAFRPVD